ncbi:cupin domain-containing protein [Candidatus Thiosymbion oneisti]|uniref:cupin domain-containing protein n=1 Tax=Candidatus Thiosymbion oneisti TaxID=589554 RepID=UPI000B7DA141|nr:cupin domain-containing protein [Candidatus Thiosymbion oneisti]
MKIISLDQTKEERGHCGIIRKMEPEGPSEIIHLRVEKAEKHYHKIATEYYYILSGKGKIFLNEEIYPIQKGDLVKIDPGVHHQALEETDVPLEILVIATPPVIGDNYTV